MSEVPTQDDSTHTSEISIEEHAIPHPSGEDQNESEERITQMSEEPPGESPIISLRKSSQEPSNEAGKQEETAVEEATEMNGNHPPAQETEIEDLHQVSPERDIVPTDLELHPIPEDDAPKTCISSSLSGDRINVAENEDNTEPYPCYSEVIFVPEKKKGRAQKGSKKKKSPVGRPRKSRSKKNPRRRSSSRFHSGFRLNHTASMDDFQYVHACMGCKKAALVILKTHTKRMHNILSLEDFLFYHTQSTTIFKYAYDIPSDTGFCAFCSLPFSTIYDLSAHMESGLHEPDARVETCDICHVKLAFTNQSAKENHIKKCSRGAASRRSIGQEEAQVSGVTGTKYPSGESTAPDEPRESPTEAEESSTFINTAVNKLGEFVDELAKIVPRDTSMPEFWEDSLLLWDSRRILQNQLTTRAGFLRDRDQFIRKVTGLLVKYTLRGGITGDVELIQLLVKNFGESDEDTTVGILNEGITHYIDALIKDGHGERDFRPILSSIGTCVDALPQNSLFRSVFLRELSLNILNGMKELFQETRLSRIGTLVDRMDTVLTVSAYFPSLQKGPEWEVVVGYSIRVSASFPLVTDRIISLFSLK